MEFSTIGAEDSLDEAKLRLESVDALIVWGSDIILGVLIEKHLSRGGNCGSACELDVLVDPSVEQNQVESITPSINKSINPYINECVNR